MRVVLDTETYYDDEYNLNKLRTIEYVRDERFLLHGVAVKCDDNEPVWLSEPEFRTWLGDLPDDVELICHNTFFDGLVLFHHYGWVPEVYRDTLSMARALLIHAPEHGLDYLGKLFGLDGKIEGTLEDTKGKRTLTPDEFERLGTYACQDVSLTDSVYQILLAGMPDPEMALIDLTMRWCCRPVLHIDLTRLAKAYRAALQERRAKIKASGVPLSVLSSQPQFLDLLRSLDIEVPMKKNKNGALIPALAKNDLGFKQMVADNPEHKELFAARLAAKSTLAHTRMKRIYKLGSRGTLPMPLKYYGAHTGRWSGTDGLNPQNFVRGSELRKSIIAPPGYVILVADLSQIELRLTLWFCNEQNQLQILRDGLDIYKATAAAHFNVPYDEVTGAQRFFGKTLCLGLGYGMGWRKFRIQCALKEIFLSESDAYQAVAKYRGTHPGIVKMWQHLNLSLTGMYQPDFEQELGPVTLVHEGILLPNDMRLDYTGLTPTENGDWLYGISPKIKKIYGGLMLENVIQALARIVMGDILLALEDLPGVTTVSSTHDEALMVVREGQADQAQELAESIMRTPPAWAPDVPLDVEAAWAKEYSK